MEVSGGTMSHCFYDVARLLLRSCEVRAMQGSTFDCNSHVLKTLELLGLACFKIFFQFDIIMYMYIYAYVSLYSSNCKYGMTSHYFMQLSLKSTIFPCSQLISRPVEASRLVLSRRWRCRWWMRSSHTVRSCQSVQTVSHINWIAPYIIFLFIVFDVIFFSHISTLTDNYCQ